MPMSDNKEKFKPIINKVLDCQSAPVSDFIAFNDELKEISQKNLGKLKNSIVRNGFTKPIITWHMKILDGHQRKIALESLAFDGYTIPKIPYVEIDVDSETKAKEILLTCAAQYGEVTKERLEYFISNNRLNALDLSSFVALPRLEDIACQEIDLNEEAPEPKSEPVAKLGDIYQLGRHRLICGDSTDRATIERLMDGQKADMVFTDPPYNVDYTGGMGTHAKNEREGILNDKMSASQFYAFLLAACRNMIDFCTGGIYICMSSSELDTLKVAFEEAGGHWQSFIIWVKNTFTLSRSDYQHTYEPILYGWPEKIKNHYFIELRDNGNVWEDIMKVKSEYNGEHTILKFQGFELKLKGKVEGQIKRGKQKTDIWRYNKPVKSDEHPTMKPIELCAEAIKNSSTEGRIVLDLFLGSGSTLIAAEKLKRSCYGCELDPKFVDVIIDRWEKMTGTKAVKLKS